MNVLSVIGASKREKERGVRGRNGERKQEREREREREREVRGRERAKKGVVKRAQWEYEEVTSEEWGMKER